MSKFDYTAPQLGKELYGYYSMIPKPHPDGQPWSKCCECEYVHHGCAFRRVNGNTARCNIQGTGIHDEALQDKIADTRFFCAHRTDDGFHRICAGWHVVYGNGKPDPGKEMES